MVIHIFNYVVPKIYKIICLLVIYSYHCISIWCGAYLESFLKIIVNILFMIFFDGQK